MGQIKDHNLGERVMEALEVAPYLWWIDGYYKEDKSEFSNEVVTSYDSVIEGYEQLDVLYYGLNESDIIASIENAGKEEDALPFVIESYRIFPY